MQKPAGSPLVPGIDMEELKATGAIAVGSGELRLRSCELVTGAGKTSKSQYDSARTKWWCKFVVFAEWDKGLIRKPNLLLADGEPNVAVIESFFRFLYGEPEVTAAIWKNALNWCQHELTQQRLVEHCLPGLPECVRRLPGVHTLSNVLRRQADEAKGFKDLQADLDGGISKPEMLEMVDFLLNMRLDSSPLGNFTTLYELRLSHQTCVRHDDIRDQVNTKLCIFSYFF